MRVHDFVMPELKRFTPMASTVWARTEVDFATDPGEERRVCSERCPDCFGAGYCETVGDIHDSHREE